MYASRKTKITCCSELWKWSPKTTFSGGVSCWHLPYQKSMCPQKTLKCTLKTKITCCSELWKWSPKTTLSGGVSCWHLPKVASSRGYSTIRENRFRTSCQNVSKGSRKTWIKENNWLEMFWNVLKCFEMLQDVLKYFGAQMLTYPCPNRRAR